MPPFQIDYDHRLREWILREHPTTTADMRYKEREHAIGYAKCRLIDGGEVHISNGQRVDVVRVEPEECHHVFAV